MIFWYGENRGRVTCPSLSCSFVPTVSWLVILFHLPLADKSTLAQASLETPPCLSRPSSTFLGRCSYLSAWGGYSQSSFPLWLYPPLTQLKVQSGPDFHLSFSSFFAPHLCFHQIYSLEKPPILSHSTGKKPNTLVLQSHSEFWTLLLMYWPKLKIWHQWPNSANSFRLKCSLCHLFHSHLTAGLLQLPK